jgi:asparagine synthase (glutamine-hydrolysing)
MCTFTVGFDVHSVSGLEIGYDERSRAEHMSYLCGTEHYEMVLKAGDMERVMPRLVWHLEEPRVGQSYPNFYAAQLASKFATVVLSGGGGDELFGGYPWR